MPQPSHDLGSWREGEDIDDGKKGLESPESRPPMAQPLPPARQDSQGEGGGFSVVRRPEQRLWWVAARVLVQAERGGAQLRGA